MANKTLSIVIPVYNEEKTLSELVKKVIDLKLEKDFKKEIVIVNDGSKDSSWQIMEDLKKKYPSEIQIFANEKNSGKSQTVKNGIVKTSGEVVVVQDADFEYEPKEINDLLSLMVDKDLDVVYGNRFGKKNKVIYLKNYIGNKALSLFSNLFTFPKIKVLIPDMEVCYKMIRGDVAREIGSSIVSKSTFGLEPEVTAKLAKYKLNGNRLKFGIVPISYYPRTMAEGKKMHAFSDGWKAFKEIIRFNIS